ncbi:MAG TPA: sugar kinase [Mycobacteriales bacterium]|jgi:2-dehydro-3-deoxygluconokinase|nr:sugar kinase [Mycobacteriales bacterium]
MTTVAIIGECMVELRHIDATTLALGYAGDTLNTAVYLSRSLDGAGSVQYLTAVGDDPYSDSMLAGWEAEGIDTHRVARVPGAHPGLYLIRVTDAGERSFTYYRSESPARRLFDEVQSPDADLAGVDLIYLSGITLSILSEKAREILWTVLASARESGARVAFDTNFRPAGWPDRAAAQETVSRTLRLTDIALPTFDDEQALFGDSDADASVMRLRGLGVAEIVVKLGAAGCIVADSNTVQAVPTSVVDDVVDTTAAGDSFNGGYLAARLTGADPVTAAGAGNRLAGVVIRHGGAIAPSHAMP